MPTSWPPSPFDQAQRRMAEWDARYVGDVDKLAATYGGNAPRTRPSQYRGGLVGTISRFF